MAKHNGGGSNYRMSKEGKTYLAVLPSSKKRGEVKRTIIESELAALIVPKREPRENRAKPQDSSQNGSV
jgi:hypothetical protein